MACKLGLAAAAAVLSIGFAASPVFAQTEQEGLVNVNVEDNTVQVPVSVAAQVCGLDVNVLTEQYVGTDQVACNIDQATAAQNKIGDGPGQGAGQGKGQPRQEGLVNVNVAGNTVQVPIGIAAQVCGVEANVIAADFAGTENVVCDIDQETAAQHNIGG